MKSFFEEFPDAYHIFCTWHLLNNVFDKNGAGVSRSQEVENLIWGLQASENKAEFDSKFVLLARESRDAAAYLGKLPRERWVTYAMSEVFGVYAHGVKTNQQVESQNGSIRGARHFPPL